MKYIYELNEFDSQNKIERIIKRIKDTGYISTSMTKELEEVTGIKGIVDKILTKVNQINDFYSKSNSDFFDDVMLEFFDGSPYTYKVNTGVYLPDRSSYLTNFYNRIKTNILIPDDYENSTNKESFLLIFLLNFVKSVNVEVYKHTHEYEKEKRKKHTWIQNPRERNITYVNYFKYFLDIQPYVYLGITHKKREEYWEMDADEFTNLEGWNSDQYCANWKKDSLSERIKKRLSYFPKLGECVEISSNDWIHSWTHMSWMEGNELIKNPNRVLLHGYLTIKFKLKQ
jgi:hypothetical protein